MNIVRVVIEGDFVDSYLYDEYLFLVDTAGVLRRYSIGNLCGELAKKTGLTQLEWRTLLSDSRLVALWSEIDRSNESQLVKSGLGDGESVRLRSKDLLPDEIDLGIANATVFDMMATYFVLFVATEVGAFRIPFHRQTRLGVGRVDGSEGDCFQMSAHLSCIAAACGSSGTKVGFSRGRGDIPDSVKVIDQRFASRVTWTGNLLVSLDDEDGFTVNRAIVEKQHISNQSNKGKRAKSIRLITGFTDDDDAKFELNQFLLPGIAETNSVFFSGNSAFAVHNRTIGGVEISFREGDVIGSALKSEYARNRRLLKVANTQSAYVVEYTKGIDAIFDDGVQGISESEALSVRTYPFSKRYRHVVTTTLEEGAMLASLVGKHP